MSKILKEYSSKEDIFKKDTFLPNKIVFSCTEKCNSFCKYCDFPKMQKKPRHMSIKNFENYVNIFNKLFDMLPNKLSKFNFILEGGEFCELEDDKIHLMFSNKNPVRKNNRKFTMFTNGQFFKKNYYKQYINLMELIEYHLTVGDDVENIRKYKEYIDKVLIVVSKENLEYQYNIVKNNPDIIFSPQPILNRKKDKQIIDKEYRNGIKKIFDLDNVYDDIEIVDRTFSDLYQKRLICANDHTRVYIDLVNNKIFRCGASRRVDTVEFTLNNMIKILLNKDRVFPTKIHKVCLSCNNNKIFHSDIKTLGFTYYKQIFNKIKQYT